MAFKIPAINSKQIKKLKQKPVIQISKDTAINLFRQEVEYLNNTAYVKYITAKFGKYVLAIFDKVKTLNPNKMTISQLVKYQKKLSEFRMDNAYETHRHQIINDKTLYPSLIEFSALNNDEVTKFFTKWKLPSNPAVASYYLRRCPLDKMYYDKAFKDARWYKEARQPFTTRQAEERNLEHQKIVQFRERHYWLPLTHQEKLYILQNNKKLTTGEYVYAGKPLSQTNLHAIRNFEKQYFENPNQFDIKKTDLEKVAEKESIKIGETILNMMSPKFAELMGFKKFAENGTKVLTNTNPNTKADVVVEVKGNKLNVEMGQKFQATTIGTTFPPQLGLNSYLKRKKAKYALDLPEAYLDDIKKGIVDLKVVDFQSVVALANTIGMLPQDLFIVACQHIVKRKKHYKDQMMIMLGTAVEELVELYNSRAEASVKKWDIKLSVRRFFKSAERIAWSKKYDYDWKNHVRFNEDFKEWRTIVSAKAVKKTN